jgi:hypothetical protein
MYNDLSWLLVNLSKKKTSTLSWNKLSVCLAFHLVWLIVFQNILLSCHSKNKLLWNPFKRNHVYNNLPNWKLLLFFKNFFIISFKQNVMWSYHAICLVVLDVLKFIEDSFEISKKFLTNTKIYLCVRTYVTKKIIHLLQLASNPLILHFTQTHTVINCSSSFLHYSTNFGFFSDSRSFVWWSDR